MNTGEYKKFLGDNHHITVEGTRYRVSPHCYGGGADLFAMVPRTDPYSEGTRDRVHSILTVTATGRAECVGVGIGRFEGGKYLAYAIPQV